MKKALILMFTTFFLYAPALYASPEKPQLLSPADTLVTLETIQESAITFGSGKNVIHTFIDPYCELSQRYLAFIFKKQERMFSNYTFHFFLYELQGKNSSQIITTILSSEYKKTLLKTVMLDHEDVPFNDDGDAQDQIELISEAAEKIGVFKRPYILINGKVK